jgi:CBS domain-containing protein
VSEFQSTDRVERLVNGPAIDVEVDETLRRLAGLMQENDVGALLVRGTAGVVGVVSERDVVRAIADGADVDDERAGDVMSPDPVTVGVDDDIARAAELMLEGGIRHLPVRLGAQKYGFVSIRDVLAVYAAQPG